MKRSIKTMLTAAMATMLLASCSDEVPVQVNNGRAIDFRGAMATRSQPIDDSSLNEICVTALLVAQDETGKDYFSSVWFGGGEKNGSLSELFTKEGSYFKSAANFYWPADKSYLQFYAFAPTIDQSTNSPFFTGATITEKLQAINFDVEDVIEKQIDLITAEAKENRTGGEAKGVTLNFKHQLSQIEIKAYGQHEKYDFYVSGVRIGRVAARGTFQFSTGLWQLGSYKLTDSQWTCDGSDRSTFSYEMPEVNGVTPWVKLPEESANALCLMPQTETIDDEGNVTSTVTHNAFLLPQTLTPWNRVADYANNTNNGEKDNEGAYIALKLKVVDKKGNVVYPDNWNTSTNTYKWAAIPIKGTWKAGKKYIYTLNLKKGAGFVDPTEGQPGTPILHDPIEFTVTVKDFEGNDDPEGTPTDLVWDNGESDQTTPSTPPTTTE